MNTPIEKCVNKIYSKTCEFSTNFRKKQNIFVIRYVYDTYICTWKKINLLLAELITIATPFHLNISQSANKSNH